MGNEFEKRPGAADAEPAANAADENTASAAYEASDAAAADSSEAAAADTLPEEAGLPDTADSAAANDTPAAAEIVFNFDFTISEVRKRAVKAHKKKLLNAFPKALLYMLLLFIPSLALYVFGMYKADASTIAGTGIKVISVLLPLIFGGPLLMGMIGGSMDISRGSRFKTGRLFFAINDSWFTKSIGSYLLFTLIELVSLGICLIPAIVVGILASSLSAGFAAIATKVIVILLIICGIVLAAQIILRFSLMFPLLIEHPDMKVMQAVRLSRTAMKGHTFRLFILFLSYIGWFLLAWGIAAIVFFAAIYAGYIYVQNVFYSGDIYTAYMLLIYGIYAAYLAVYVLAVISTSTVIMRPFVAFAAFYDAMTGYKHPEETAESEESAEYEGADDVAALPEADVSTEATDATDTAVTAEPAGADVTDAAGVPESDAPLSDGTGNDHTGSL